MKLASVAQRTRRYPGTGEWIEHLGGVIGKAAASHQHASVGQQSGSVRLAGGLHGKGWRPCAACGVVELGTSQSMGAIGTTGDQHSTIRKQRRRMRIARIVHWGGWDPIRAGRIVDFCTG